MFSGLTILIVGSAYKEMVMHQFLKIVGITAEQLVHLHRAVEEAKADRKIYANPGAERPRILHPQAELIKSELDTKDTPRLYTVTIKVPITVFGADEKENKAGTLYLSIGILRMIYNALGVFPDQETFVNHAN